jgi:hypothetical protein
MREFSERMSLEYPVPEFLAPYSALFADPEGLLWVITSIPGDEATELRAIGADGEIVAPLRLSIDRVIYEAGRDYILGTYEDGDGEPHVVMNRIRRGE